MKIAEPIKLDGELNEPAWSKAEPAGDFLQAEPHEGEPATERTEVRILYSEENLYIGFRCFDREPGKILTTSLKEDFDSKDQDGVEVILDTLRDKRNGFLFITNPHGAKRDAQVTDEGRNVDADWDTIWDVRTHIDNDGWTAEIVVPFKSLSLNETSGEQTWGINFTRRIRRKNEIDYWTHIPRIFDVTRLSLAGELQGLVETERGRNLRLKPYVAADVEKFAQENHTVKKSKAGLDVKYNVTPTLVLDLTGNTDFSQVEADEQQVNLSRFRLFFPEKREFFLENSGIFQFGDVPLEMGPNRSKEVQLFFSRRIGLSPDGAPIPIWGGARLSGEVGKFGIGLLTMQTKETAAAPSNNYAVARVKRDILANSDIGAIFVNRQASRGNDYNRAFGGDANFRFGPSFTVNGYAARTLTHGLKGNDDIEKVSVQWKDRVKRFQVSYVDDGDNFNPEVGFQQRRGSRIFRTRDDLYLRPWKNSFIRELNPHYLITYYMDQHGNTVTKEVHYAFMQMFFQNGASMEFHYDPFFDRPSTPFRVQRNVVLPPGDYHYGQWILELASNQSKKFAGSTTIKKGTYYSGHITAFDGSGVFRPNFRFSVEGTVSVNSIELPQAKFHVNLARAKINYYFNTRMFLSALIQYNNDLRQVSSNIRFNFIHHPLSDLFVVYNEEREVAGARRLDRALSIKYTHMIPF